MKQLIASLLLLCVPGAQAQSFDHIAYKQQVNPAYEIAIKEKKYTESLQKLEAVNKKYGMLYGEDYRLQAYCYKMTGNNSLAAQSLKTSWSSLSFDMRTLWYVAPLDPGKIMEGFSEAENALVYEGFDNSAKIRPKNADSLIAVIDSMTYWDQFFRTQLNDSPYDQKVISELDSMNRVNEALLEKMVRKIGFPGEKKLQFSEFSIWFVLVHTAGNESFYQRMKPVFLQEVRIGNMSPWIFANWVDQHQFYNKLPTIYNTQVGLKNDFTKKELEEIRKNRFEIGLMDLEFTFYH